MKILEKYWIFLFQLLFEAWTGICELYCLLFNTHLQSFVAHFDIDAELKWFL